MYWPKAKFYSIFYYPLPHYDIQKSGNTGDNITFSGVLSTYPFVHTLEKFECDQEGGGINTGY